MMFLKKLNPTSPILYFRIIDVQVQFCMGMLNYYTNNSLTTKQKCAFHIQAVM